ncbi:MAG TPA: hemolysin family protein [Terriglobia bacterium]|nr:hemolysin family protein [Terriglobia bacterium]
MFTILILPLLAFFALSAFFSLSETAIFASNKYKVRHLASQGNKPAQKLIEWLDVPDKLLATLLLGNNFASIGAATVSAAIVSRIVVSPQALNIALAIETVVLTIVILLFCELGPKALATRYPERISLRVVLPIEVFMKLFYPVTKYGLKVTGLLFRNVQQTPEMMAAEASEAELRALLNSNKGSEHSQMLERVLEFSQRQVKDVMVPRIEVTAIDINTPFDEILLIVESTRYSRFPIYQGVLDNVVGILHGKDLMPYLHYPKTFRLSQLLRKPVFIPDTARLNNAVRLLQNAQTHLGIVVDEHGGVEGIVTLEDLIEQIVGEIQDEHDVEVDSVGPHIDGTIGIDASISVRELNERLSLNIPETGQYVTLAGFLLAKAGHLMKEGEEIEFDDCVFRVEQMIGRRIMRVRLTRALREPAQKHAG